MSGNVWYISVNKKKIEFKKYPSKQKNKKTVKKATQKSTNSAKKLLINLILASSLIFFLSIVSAAEINDTFHINLQTTYANGSIETGTFIFAFNITENSDSSCLGPIVYNHSVQKITDTRGIVSLYLPTIGSSGGNLSELSFDKQYYLCYYRNGTLKDVSQLGRVPYAFRATQVNLSEISVDTDFNMTDYNITDVKYGFFQFLGSLASRITSLFVQDVDVSGDIDVAGDIEVGGDVNVTGNVSASWFKGIFDWIVGTASQIYLSFNGTQLDFDESQLNQTIDTRITSSEGELHVNMSDYWNTGDRGALRSISQIQGSWLTNDFSWINFTDGDTRYILITDESDLNVNRSEWWKTTEGDLNDVSDILGSWLTNDLAWINLTEGDTQYLLITDEANLNVNASDYWITDEGVKKNVVDILGSEITNDLGWINQTQGDERYVEVAGDTMTGSLAINANLTIGTNVLFVDSNNNVVGIGTVTPQNTLNVVGEINATTNIYGNLIFQAGNEVLDTSTMFDGDVSGTYNVLQLGTGVVGTINLVNGSVTAVKIAPNAVNTTHIVDGTILDADIATAAGIQWSKLSNYPYIIAGAGLTGGGQLDQNRTISIAFGDAFLGWANLTDYPEGCPAGQAVRVIGDTLTCIDVENATILEGYPASFFMPLNKSVSGTFDFNGGWMNDGLSIDGGDLYAQTVYVYNITSLNVTEQDLTIVDDLIVYGNTELKKNLTVDTDTLFVDSNTDMVGIGTTSPGALLETGYGPLWTTSSWGKGIKLVGDSAIQLGSTGTRYGITGDTSGKLRIFSTTGDNTSVAITDIITINDGNVGIGTTTPQNTLNVIGDLNVTGLCVAENSLISMADGTKKEIKDVQVGEYVLSLDEETGEIVSNKVKEVLDMGEKPIYELMTESGRAINTTGNHPYLVRDDSVSFVVVPEGEEHNYFVDFINFEFEDKTFENVNSSFSSKLMSERFIVTRILDDFIYLSSKGFFKNRIFSTDLVNFSLAFRMNNLSITHFLNSSSTELNLMNGPFFLSLSSLTNSSFIGSSSTGCQLICSQNSQSSSVISLVCLNLADMSCFINRTTALDINLKSNSVSGEVVNSAINENSDEEYLKLSDGAEWLKVIDLEEGMEIAVPDYEQNTIKWEKITSIEQHPAQHVYDLAIEGTHNFIANDIVAHNTYINGVNVTGDFVPYTGSTKNVVLGVNNFSVDSNVLFVDSNSDRVGVGKSDSEVKFDVSGGARFMGSTRSIEGELVYNDAGNYYQFYNGTQWVILTGGAATYNGTLWAQKGNNIYYNDGDVGIGTEDPLSNLVVTNNAFNGSSSWAFAVDSSTSDSSTAAANFLDSGGNSLMYIRSDGKVGIGTTNPNAKLHVYGDSQTDFGVYDTPLIVKGDTYSYIYINGTSNQAGILLARDTTQGFFTGLNNDGKYRIADLATIDQTGLTNAKDGTEGITIQTDGNVGIGTASPSFSWGNGLEIASANAAIRMHATGDGGLGYIEFTNESNDVTYQMGYRDSTQNFEIHPGTTWGSNFIMDSSGNVLIGNNPGLSVLDSQLQIYKTDLPEIILRTAGRYLNETTDIKFTAGNEVRSKIHQSLSNIDAGGEISFHTGAGGALVDRLHIQSGGNVGIGTASPHGPLEVVNGSSIAPAISGNAIGHLIVGKEVSMGLAMGGYSTGGAGGYSWIQSTILDAAQYNNTLALNPNGGNVGIGVTDPDTALEVAGIIKLTGGYQTFYDGATLTGYIGDAVNMGFAGLTNDDLVIRGVDGIGFTSNDGTSDAMYINSSGNVGIGTTTPNQKLDVNGIIIIDRRALTADPRLIFAHNDIGSDNFITVDRNTDKMHFYQAGAFAMTIDSSQNVGIGDTGPEGKLEVAGDIEIEYLEDRDGTNFFDGGCSADQYISGIDSTGAITCAGDSGTGTMSSWTIAGDSGSTAVTNGQTVTVAGSGTIDTSESTRTVTVSVQANSIDDAQVVDNGLDASSLAADSVSDSELDGGFGWTLDTDLNIDSNTLVVSQDDNRVGIGTASPGTNLEIKGGVSTELRLPLSINSGYYLSGSAIGIGFLTDGTPTYTKGALVYRSAGSGWNLGHFDFLLRSDSNINPVTLADSKMTILNSGNVGIGDTGPEGKLEVAGDIEIEYLEDRDGTNFFDGGCSADQYISGIDSTGAITCAGDSGTGTMSSFTLAGTSGSGQTITQGNTALIEAGTGITTTGAATDKVTVAATLGTAIDYTEITAMTEANLYTRLSDVSQFWENGDAVTGAIGANEVWAVGWDGDTSVPEKDDIYDWASGVTTTEMDYLQGVSSDIQTQLGGKDNYGSWTIAGDSGTSTVSSGQTATIAGSGTIDTAESGRTVTVSVQANSIDDAQVVDNGLDASSLAADSVSDSELDGGFGWTLDTDLNIDSNTLVVSQDDNRVGIGTAGPTEKLQVHDGTTGSTRFNIKITGGTHLGTSAYGIGFDPEGYTARTKMALVVTGGGYGHSKGDFHFLSNTVVDGSQATLADSKVIIKNDGNVGIGTTGPLAKLAINGGLHVGGDSDPGDNNALIDGTLTLGDQLNMAEGSYEGSIVFGTVDAWHTGIRQHDDSNAELRIWAKEAAGKIFLATGYDGEPADIAKPTDGLVVQGNNVGIGDFSASDPAYDLHVKGTGGFTSTVTAPTFVAGATTLSGRLYMNSGTNLHLDSNAAGITYINYYGGTGGVNFCNGTNGCSASVSAAGAISAATLDTGYGANELWDMDQHVLTSSAVTFSTLSINEIYADLGAANDPSYTFTGDDNTGMYSSTADTIVFTAGGVNSMSLSSGGVWAYTSLNAPDHGAAATDQVVNVAYTTTTCPAAGGTTIGTLCIKYTA